MESVMILGDDNCKLKYFAREKLNDPLL